jgi:hypothetical protein
LGGSPRVGGDDERLPGLRGSDHDRFEPDRLVDIGAVDDKAQGGGGQEK